MDEIDGRELSKVYEFIDSLNREDAVVVVEGKRDKEALRSLGYRGDTLILNNFKSIYRMAEYLERLSKVILLFDMDRKGDILTDKMLSILGNVDLLYKKRLKAITKGRIRCIEELVLYSRYQSICSKYIE